MAQIDINKIINTAEQGIIHLAETTFNTYANEAIADGKAFLVAAQADIRAYTQQLADGTITLDEFKDYINADAVLAKMIALKQAGLAQAAIDSFVSGAISIIITAAISAIP